MPATSARDTAERPSRWPRAARLAVHLAASAAIALCLLLSGSAYDGLRDIAPDLDPGSFEVHDDRTVVLAPLLGLAALLEGATLAISRTMRERIVAAFWLAALLAAAVHRFPA